ncbi:phosphonate ABC transporter ATP-binding protein [Dethiobacter alkaliphilus]|uniref:Phosphonate ABC transporter, ATPase subunit n=1 Tax=Dethiobacter alkaliphilus AHT 1 TaxID=555088 RepID=C0GFX5_DETAL|nr:phosphonate ABC transporter ATP-binding protein [Dethiobacter alkaliphilus]EEG77664.1 phosphonate ABC transporter, ATPase subunit [Dethiobacter alkaliphilus AHT 1]
MLLTIDNLTMRYPRAESCALDNVALNLTAGERVAVLGQSGSGKSTLVRCINRLVEPQSGRVAWDGQDVLGLKPEQLKRYRRDVGMIFQNFALVDRLDVLHNVLVGSFGRQPWWRPLLGRYSAEEVAMALDALKRVGMSDKAAARADRLSGGQRQRVGIARALMQKPRLILGDEPVSSLDPVIARSVLSLLREISEQDSIAVLLNLHNVELARFFAHRIVGIHAGRIVYDGPADGLTNEVLARVYPPEA